MLALLRRIGSASILTTAIHSERFGLCTWAVPERCRAEVKGGENLHILGYFYPGSNSAELEKQLRKIRTGRHKRGKKMLKKLVGRIDAVRISII